jgi:8-oxo-dGTP diphosphatase
LSDPAKQIALVAAFDKKGRLLLGKRRDTGKWTMPGGHLDPGEIPLQGARRELWEEARLRAEAVKLWAVKDNPGARLHVFRALVDGQADGSFDPDAEVSEWRWFDVSRGLPKELHGNLQGPPGAPANVLVDSLGLEKGELSLEKADPPEERRQDRGRRREYGDRRYHDVDVPQERRQGERREKIGGFFGQRRNKDESRRKIVCDHCGAAVDLHSIEAHDVAAGHPYKYYSGPYTPKEAALGSVHRVQLLQGQGWPGHTSNAGVGENFRDFSATGSERRADPRTWGPRTPEHLRQPAPDPSKIPPRSRFELLDVDPDVALPALAEPTETLPKKIGKKVGSSESKWQHLGSLRVKDLYDYSHHLPENLRSQGYALYGYDNPSGEAGGGLNQHRPHDVVLNYPWKTSGIEAPLDEWSTMYAQPARSGHNFIPLNRVAHESTYPQEARDAMSAALGQHIDLSRSGRLARIPQIPEFASQTAALETEDPARPAEEVPVEELPRRVPNEFADKDYNARRAKLVAFGPGVKHEAFKLPMHKARAFDYSHHLSDESRREGYGLTMYHWPAEEAGGLHVPLSQQTSGGANKLHNVLVTTKDGETVSTSVMPDQGSMTGYNRQPMHSSITDYSWAFDSPEFKEAAEIRRQFPHDKEKNDAAIVRQENARRRFGRIGTDVRSARELAFQQHNRLLQERGALEAVPDESAGPRQELLDVGEGKRHRRAKEAEDLRLKNLELSETDEPFEPLEKMQRIAGFPQLGVEDRRETPYVDESNVNRKAHQIKWALNESFPKPKSPMQALANDAAARQETNDVMRNSGGAVMSFPSHMPKHQKVNVSFAYTNPTEAAVTGMEHGPRSKGDVSTKSHEDFHQMMYHVQKLHGSEARQNLAQNLWNSLPPFEKRCATSYAEHRNQLVDPRNPNLVEEHLAILHNYLNDPEERERFYKDVGYSMDEPQVRTHQTGIKRAMRYLNHVASKKVDRSWLTPYPGRYSGVPQARPTRSLAGYLVSKAEDHLMASGVIPACRRPGYLQKSEASNLIKHPSAAERRMAIRLDSVSADDLADAMGSPDAELRAAARFHPKTDREALLRLVEGVHPASHVVEALTHPSIDLGHLRAFLEATREAPDGEEAARAVADHPLADGPLIAEMHAQGRLPASAFDHPLMPKEVVDAVAGTLLDGGLPTPSTAAAIRHPLLDPELATRLLKGPHGLEAAGALSLPEDSQVEVMKRGLYPAFDGEAGLRRLIASRPTASARVISMALEDRDPPVRSAPFERPSKHLGPEHFDRVLQRAEPAQVLAAAKLPGWTAEHTARLAAKPEFGAQLLAAHLLSAGDFEKAEDLEKMAVADIPKGAPYVLSNGRPSEESLDYSHVLKPEHREQGYRLKVVPDPTGYMSAYLYDRANPLDPVGRVSAFYNKSDNSITPHSKLNAAHRGKGLGVAMYEALLAHAYHSGARRVTGENHSEGASRVHRALAAKHGMDYRPAPPDPKGQSEVEMAPGESVKLPVGPYDYAIKGEDDLEKAIGDIAVGPSVPVDPDLYRPQDYKSYDYNHVLTPEQRSAGYGVTVSHHKNGTVYAHVLHDGGRVGEFSGEVNAQRWPGAIFVGSTRLDPMHRGKGLGLAGYEALFAHAKNALGLQRVEGGKHTLKAARVHAALARKHGLQYQMRRLASDSTGLEYHEPYDYAIKGEDDLSKGEATDALAGHLGFDSRLEGARRAASFFGKEADDHGDRLRRALWEHDGDQELASLAAHGAEADGDNLRALRGVLSSQGAPARPVLPMAQPAPDTSVSAVFPEGQEVAEGVEKGFRDGFAVPIELPGRNNPSPVVVRDRDGGRAWLLKRVNPRVEAAFSRVAEKWGIDPWFAKVQVLNVGGQERAAVDLKPWSWKSMDDRRRLDPNAPGRALAPFLQAGVLHRLAALDYVMANGDRNFGNVLVDPEGKRFECIDEGNALDPAFDPGADGRSYVPAYLRAWVSGRFNGLPAAERLKKLPRLGAGQADELGQWVAALDEHELAAELTKHGFDPGACMARLAKLKAMAKAEPADLAINRAWVGA